VIPAQENLLDDSSGPIELPPSTGAKISVVGDGKGVVPELDVWLVSVADVHLPCAAGVDHLLDAFYVELLGMQRLDGNKQSTELAHVFRTDNFCLILEIMDRPVEHERIRPTMIGLPSVPQLERKLIEREINFERVTNLTRGQDYLLIMDPAGNYVGVVHHQPL